MASFGTQLDESSFLLDFEEVLAGSPGFDQDGEVSADCLVFGAEEVFNHVEYVSGSEGDVFTVDG